MAVNELKGHTLRVCALYPDLMNIYADRGNLFVLQRRCEWRGIGFQLSGSGLGEALDGEAHDIYYIGGGQDRDQLLCAEDLGSAASARPCTRPPRAARSCWACAVATSCLASPTRSGTESEGVGLLDVRTVREPGERLIGNVAIEDSILDGEKRVLAGFENHGGRTYLGSWRHAAGPSAQRSRQRRPQRLRGGTRWQHDRHIPPRPAAAQEHVVCGLADRDGARVSTLATLAPLDDDLERQPTRALAARRQSDRKYRRTRLVQLSATAGVASRSTRTIVNREFGSAPGWSSTLPPAATKLLDPVLTELQLARARGIATRPVSGRVRRLGCYALRRLAIVRR